MRTHFLHMFIYSVFCLVSGSICTVIAMKQDYLTAYVGFIEKITEFAGSLDNELLQLLTACLLFSIVCLTVMPAIKK